MAATDHWTETCSCGASLKLTGWSPFPNDKTSAEKAAEKWRREHKCQQQDELVEDLGHKFNKQDIWMEHFQTRLNDLHSRLSKIEGDDDDQ